MTDDNNNTLVAVTKKEIGGVIVDTADARELHQFLNSKREFATWIKSKIKKYKFQENQDFIVFDKIVKNPKGGRNPKEYTITLDMAKELSMVEGTEKGREARQYFIKCERIALGQQSATPALSGNDSQIQSKPTSPITPVLYEGVTVLVFHEDSGHWVSLRSLCDVTGLDYKWQKTKNAEYQFINIQVGNESVLAMPYQQAINWLNDINPEKIQFKKRSKVVSARLELPALIKQAVDNAGGVVCIEHQETVKPKPKAKKKAASMPFKTIVTIIHKSGDMDTEEYNEPVMVMSVAKYLQWRDKMTELEDVAMQLLSPRQLNWGVMGDTKALEVA